MVSTNIIKIAKFEKTQTMKRLFTLLAALCFCVAAYTQDSYRNPVIPGTYPDPSICRVGEDYYLINSSFNYFPGVPLWHSKDLVHWERVGNVLDRPSQIPLEGATRGGGIFAPTIRYNEGVFYMVTTNVTGGGNFFVTTSDLAKGWSDPVWLEQGGIDPSFYFEDGHCYMVSNPDGTIMLCEVNPVNGKTLVPSRPLWRGTGGRYPEAPHIYKKDGWYYLMISEGGTEYGHMVTIARSRSIEGPYESNPSNPILTHRNQNAETNPIQAVGHSDFVQAPDGSWWMVCLGIRPQVGQNHLMGRETFLTPVDWPEGEWPVINGNGTIALDMKVAPPAWYPFPADPVRTDFRKIEKFGPEWAFVRNPDSSRYAFDAVEGLVMTGCPDGLDAWPSSPSFVGRRQSDIEFSAFTKVSLKADDVGDAAGLTVFLDAAKHYDVFVTQEEYTSFLEVRYRLDQLDCIAAKVEIPSCKDVFLRIDGFAEYYEFSYSLDAQTYTKVGSMGTRYLSEEVQGGFTGCFIGLWCESSNSEGSAAFEFFEYR